MLNYAVSSTILYLLFIGIFIFTKITFLPSSSKRQFLPSLGYIFPTLTLMLISPVVIGLFAKPVHVELPVVTGWRNGFLFCLSVATAACFEELLYRVILFEGAMLLPGFRKKRLRWIGRLFSLTLFACAHRYLGVGAVINAFLLGGLLHLLYEKTGRVEISCLAHGMYNLILFFLQGGEITPSF